LQEENENGSGLLALVSKSDQELATAKKEILRFQSELAEDDLRYDLFKTVSDILIDNIE
jgi:hypothetical protein